MPEEIVANPNGMSTRTKVILVAVTGGAIALAAVVVGLVWKKRHPKAVANATEQESHE